MDTDEFKARRLTYALRTAGVPEARVHWDRSPWGVSIPLTPNHDEYAPRLYVLTEQIETPYGGFTWHGSIGGLEVFENMPVMMMHETDLTFEFIERGDVTDMVQPIILLWSLLSAGLQSILTPEEQGDTTDGWY